MRWELYFVCLAALLLVAAVTPEFQSPINYSSSQQTISLDLFSAESLEITNPTSSGYGMALESDIQYFVGLYSSLYVYAPLYADSATIRFTVNNSWKENLTVSVFELVNDSFIQRNVSLIQENDSHALYELSISSLPTQLVIGAQNQGERLNQDVSRYILEKRILSDNGVYRFYGQQNDSVYLGVSSSELFQTEANVTINQTGMHEVRVDSVARSLPPINGTLGPYVSFDASNASLSEVVTYFPVRSALFDQINISSSQVYVYGLIADEWVELRTREDEVLANTLLYTPEQADVYVLAQRQQVTRQPQNVSMQEPQEAGSDIALVSWWGYAAIVGALLIVFIVWYGVHSRQPTQQPLPIIADSDDERFSQLIAYAYNQLDSGKSHLALRAYNEANSLYDSLSSQQDEFWTTHAHARLSSLYTRLMEDS